MMLRLQTSTGEPVYILPLQAGQLRPETIVWQHRTFHLAVADVHEPVYRETHAMFHDTAGNFGKLQYVEEKQ